MVRACAVRDCKNNLRTKILLNKPSLLFHRFPRSNSRLMKKWIRFCQKDPSWAPTISACICSEHFTRDNYTQKYDPGRRILIKDALPTIPVNATTNGLDEDGARLFQMEGHDSEEEVVDDDVEMIYRDVDGDEEFEDDFDWGDDDDDDGDGGGPMVGEIERDSFGEMIENSVTSARICDSSRARQIASEVLSSSSDIQLLVVVTPEEVEAYNQSRQAKRKLSFGHQDISSPDNGSTLGNIFEPSVSITPRRTELNIKEKSPVSFDKNEIDKHSIQNKPDSRKRILIVKRSAPVKNDSPSDSNIQRMKNVSSIIVKTGSNNATSEHIKEPVSEEYCINSDDVSKVIVSTVNNELAETNSESLSKEVSNNEEDVTTNDVVSKSSPQKINAEPRESHVSSIIDDVASGRLFSDENELEDYYSSFKKKRRSQELANNIHVNDNNVNDSPTSRDASNLDDNAREESDSNKQKLFKQLNLSPNVSKYYLQSLDCFDDDDEEEDESSNQSGDDNSLLKKATQQKVKILQQRLKRRDMQIRRLKGELFKLNQSLRGFDEVTAVLNNNFSGFMLQLALHEYECKLKSSSDNGMRYRDEIKTFAKTIYLQSASMYRYMRTLFKLPHPSNMRMMLKSLKNETRTEDKKELVRMIHGTDFCIGEDDDYAKENLYADATSGKHLMPSQLLDLIENCEVYFEEDGEATIPKVKDFVEGTMEVDEEGGEKRSSIVVVQVKDGGSSVVHEKETTPTILRVKDEPGIGSSPMVNVNKKKRKGPVKGKSVKIVSEPQTTSVEELGVRIASEIDPESIADDSEQLTYVVIDALDSDGRFINHEMGESDELHSMNIFVKEEIVSSEQIESEN